MPTKPIDVHDIHDFVMSSQRTIEEEYLRIQKRATEDPGTAGDQGEENWASLLRSWLPAYFQVVTKGRILMASNYVSPQVDVLVLVPAYPKILIDKKLYLAGGVAAAFECKTTIIAQHINSAVETSVKIKKNLPKRVGTPYKELNSSIIYGLLAHSHSWKGEKSTPVVNIQKTLVDADGQFVKHPVECIDYVCVADLGTWSAYKMTYLSPKLPMYNEAMAAVHGPNGTASSAYMASVIGGERQESFFSPIGALLSGLYSKLAWNYPDMRNLEQYFRLVNLLGSGGGLTRRWDISIYSEEIRDRVFNGLLSNGSPFDEWSLAFF